MLTLVILWCENEKRWIRISHDENKGIVVHEAQLNENFTNVATDWIPCDVGKDIILRSDYVFEKNEVVEYGIPDFYLVTQEGCYKSSAQKNQWTSNYYVQEYQKNHWNLIPKTKNDIINTVTNKIENYPNSQLTTKHKLPKTPGEFEEIRKAWNTNFELQDKYHTDEQVDSWLKEQFNRVFSENFDYQSSANPLIKAKKFIKDFNVGAFAKKISTLIGESQFETEQIKLIRDLKTLKEYAYYHMMGDLLGQIQQRFLQTEDEKISKSLEEKQINLEKFDGIQEEKEEKIKNVTPINNSYDLINKLQSNDYSEIKLVSEWLGNDKNNHKDILNIKDKNNNTPLIYAIKSYKCNAKIISLMIQKGATYDVDKKIPENLESLKAELDKLKNYLEKISNEQQNFEKIIELIEPFHQQLKTYFNLMLDGFDLDILKPAFTDMMKTFLTQENKEKLQEMPEIVINEKTPYDYSSLKKALNYFLAVISFGGFYHYNKQSANERGGHWLLWPTKKGIEEKTQPVQNFMETIEEKVETLMKMTSN